MASSLSFIQLKLRATPDFPSINPFSFPLSHFTSHKIPTSSAPAESRPQFRKLITLENRSHNSILSPNFSPFSESSSASIVTEGAERECEVKSSSLQKWILLVQSFVPGGSWWSLCYSVDFESRKGKSMRVLFALRRIWALVAGDRWVIFIAFASLTVAALSEISIPNLLAASIFSAQNGERVMFYRNLHLLALLCLTSGICSGLRGGCFGVANMILVRRMREMLYSAFIFQDVSFFDREPVGNLTSRLSADCQQLSNVISHNIHLILRNVLQGTGAFINLLMLSWPLALSSLAICFILSSISMFYGQYRKVAAKFSQDVEAHANEVAQDAFSLVRTIRVVGAEKEELGRYEHWLNKLTFINLRASVAYGLWNLSFSTMYRFTQVLAVVVGGLSVSVGHISPEQLLKYVLYCEWLIYATWRLVDNAASLLESVGASEKAFQFMDLLPSNQFLSKGVKLRQLNGHIQFVNVSFCYPTRIKALVLEHLNISMQANKVIGIVGLSGSGKSTLAKLLLRLYDPTDGEILIDGVPLKDLDTVWLRDKMAYVGQEPHLFRMDVKSNIVYGCTRDVTQEDIEWASRLAAAHKFISSLPNGYHTLVDDYMLSGGQRQRIAIARAILRKPAIMILDEATSALDVENEHYITEILHSLREDSKVKGTVILIAHRLSTVRAADKILVMDGGQVVEMGNHRELLQKNGLYSRLVNMRSNILG
ncbi:ABC transporter B member 26, chloroplastic [Ancistrocladus abbreviatus]